VCVGRGGGWGVGGVQKSLQGSAWHPDTEERQPLPVSGSAPAELRQQGGTSGTMWQQAGQPFADPPQGSPMGTSSFHHTHAQCLP
jgi:hypothetical protein